MHFPFLHTSGLATRLPCKAADSAAASVQSSKPSVMKTKSGGADKEQPASSAAGVFIPYAKYLCAVSKYTLWAQLPLVSS